MAGSTWTATGSPAQALPEPSGLRAPSRNAFERLGGFAVIGILFLATSLRAEFTVYWDASHGLIDGRHHPLDAYSDLIKELGPGYRFVEGEEPLDSRVLDGIDILVVARTTRERSFFPAELMAIRGHLGRGGGLLVLADAGSSRDTAHIQQVYDLFGARLIGDLRGEDVFSTLIVDHPLFVDVEQIYFRTGSSIEPGSLRPVAWQNFSVMVAAGPYGGGKVVLVGDTSLFRREDAPRIDYFDRADNRRFARNLLSFLATSCAASDGNDGDGNGISDVCEPDCNGNGTADASDISSGMSNDCDANGIPDECELDALSGRDCNGNGVLDECDVASGTSDDCNGDGRPDECFDRFLAFRTVWRVPVSGRPVSLVTDDFDGDGVPDFATSNEDVDTVSVLLNRSGDFVERRTHCGGDLPRYLVEADFDQDGRVDLATGNVGSRDLSVLLGRGDGLFEAPLLLPALEGVPSAIAAGDIDGDGSQDLAAASQIRNGGLLSVFPGNGDGTFGARRDFALHETDDPVAMIIDDVDGDGILDVLVSEWLIGGGGGISILFGTGGGELSQARRIPASCGGPGDRLATADIDGDGRLDLVTRNIEGDVSVYSGPLTAPFDPPECLSSLGVSSDFAVVDLDEDGRLDLVFVDGTSVAVSRGREDGTFGEEERFAAAFGARALSVSDVDQDGFADIVTANGRDDSVSILRGLRGGAYRSTRQFVAPDDVNTLVAEEMTGDGVLDLVAVGRDGVSFLAGRADGTFEDGSTIYPGGSPGAAALDADRDGLLDLVLAAGSEVLFLRGRGDGTFAEPRRFENTGRATALLAGPLDGDGFDDVAVLTIAPRRVSVLRGDAAGSFESPVEFDVPAESDLFFLGDIDGDGLLDFLVGSSREDLVVAYENAGDLEWRESLRIDVASPRALLLEDLDSDGALDLLVASRPGDPQTDLQLMEYAGFGDGSFRLVQSVPYAGMVRTIVTADLLPGGGAEVILNGTDSSGPARLSVIHRRADGSWSLAADLRTILSSDAVLVRDVNADGRLDLVTGTFYSRVSVVLQEVLDCNSNAIADACEIENGPGADADGNGVLDECETDCNGNSRPDVFDVAGGVSSDCNVNAVPDECDVSGGFSEDVNANGIPDECDVKQVRGDCNGDGKVELSDCVCTFGWLFVGNVVPPCLAALNANGNATLDISDAVYVLHHLFRGGPPPIAPFPGCGVGHLAVDELFGCESGPPDCPEVGGVAR